MKDGRRDAELARDVGPERAPVPRAHLLPDARRGRHAQVGVVRVEGHDLRHSSPDLDCYFIQICCEISRQQILHLKLVSGQPKNTETDIIP